MNTAEKGNAAERFIIKWLEGEGWVCASRRHIKGPGDILAYHPLTAAVWLVEAKERKNVWGGFRKPERKEMLDYVKGTQILPWVCNKKGKDLLWIPARGWPK